MQIQNQNITASEKLARLRLARTKNVGPVTYRQLIHRFGSAIEALEKIPELARRGGAKLSPYPKATAEREIAAITQLGAEWVVLGDMHYPKLLGAMEDAPPVLIYKGAAHLMEKPCVGMVGARNASAVGRKIAGLIAQEVGEAGYVVISGLARGIDTAAHQASLKTGTIAAIAGGINVVYPRENAELQDAISAQGLLVTEMPPGTKPQARHFPRRNRLIAGLSLGVIVVEAAARSGSLITARIAGEQGREVMAVPGSPMDPRAQGANSLIRNGATLVENAQDVIDALSGLRRLDLGEMDIPSFQGVTMAQQDPSEGDRDKVREALGFAPVSVDEIIRSCALEAAMVATILLELELAGKVERHAGNRVSLTA